MGTVVSVNTYVHTVTYVTDKMLTSLRQVITGIGLNPSKFVENWSTNELAVKTWLGSKDLKEAVLEITSSSGTFVTRYDFNINYSYGDGDGSMWVDPDVIRNSIIKLGHIPSSCNYKLILRVGPGAPDVPGWGNCEFLSTTGYVRQSLGTTIGTNSIGAEAGYWRKIS